MGGGGKKNGKGRGRGKEVEGSLREMEGQYDRLLDVFGEDEVGREKAKSLGREDKRYVDDILTWIDRC